MERLELFDSCNLQWLVFENDLSEGDLETIDNYENGIDSAYYSLNEVLETCEDEDWFQECIDFYNKNIKVD